MGGSSRPNDYDPDSFTAQQSIDYFVDYLEKWRVNMKITGFNLLGHSFGGYIAGNYSVKYPQHVRKLILMSPIGIRQQPEDENWEERLK